MQVSREDVGALAIAVMQLTDRLGRARARVQDRTELGVLRVAAPGGLRPTEIAGELRMHLSSVTRRLQVLERAGKVALRRDPADSRASLVEVTAAGYADLWSAYDQGVGIFEELVADWKPAEVSAFTASLNRLIAALDERTKKRDAEREPGQ